MDFLRQEMQGDTRPMPGNSKSEAQSLKVSAGKLPDGLRLDGRTYAGKRVAELTAGLLAEQEYQAALSTDPTQTLQLKDVTLNNVTTKCPKNSKGFCGYNTTFDLWSTGGTTTTDTTNLPKWVKNW